MAVHPVSFLIMRLAAGAVCVVVLATFGAQTLRADDATTRFFEQLRQRNLFGLVEAECLRRLEASSMRERDRVELVLELSRTYAAHAWQTVDSEQADLWLRAKRVVQDFLSKSPQSTRRGLLEVQLALVDLSQAEWSLAQWELQPDNMPLQVQGVTSVDAALARFLPLEKSLNEQVRNGSAASPSGIRSDAKESDSLRPFELRGLWQQVRFRLGTARLVQAKLVTKESADRASALVAADEWLPSLAAGPSGDRLTIESQLVLAEVARLKGELDRAAKVLATIEKTSLEDFPEDLRERFVIERIRWWLAKGQPTEAAQWLMGHRDDGREKTFLVNSATSEELAYWQVVVELALWRVAAERGEDVLANDLWKRVESSAAKLDPTGGYWWARSQLDWQTARETKQFGPELATLVRRARAAFATGNVADSLTLYDTAIAQAKRSRQEKLLLELNDLRASLLFQTKRFEEAAVAFQELANAPLHERSAATHLLWAFCLGKQFDQQPTDARRDDLAQSLKLLIERHPAAPETAEATWLLGQLAERQLRFTEALERFLSIPESHARHDDAIAATARCHERLIAQLRADNQLTTDAEKTAITLLLPIANKIVESAKQKMQPTPASNADDDDLPFVKPDAQLKRAHAELLTRVAQILLERQPPDYANADRLLEQVLVSSRDATWRKTAQQLRVVSLAGQSRIDDAERLLDGIEATGPDELLSLLDGLATVSSQSDRRMQRLIAELQLKATKEFSLAPQGLTAPQQLRMWRTRAAAFAATGQPSNAILLYKRLLEKSPRDTKLLRAAAELCELLDSTDGLQQAKTFWRRLENVLKAGSADWFDARWHVTRCCYKLGEHAEAEKLLKVTKLLYPDLGGPAIKARFEELDLR